MMAERGPGHRWGYWRRTPPTCCLAGCTRSDETWGSGGRPCGGNPLRVIGIYPRPRNFCEPPGAPKIAAVVPFATARRSFHIDETNALVIAVKPRSSVPVSVAVDAVTLQLRRMRGIRTGDPNTFDVVTADQILGIFDRLTGVFFLVMIVLSSVALMVGGIGVMA